MPFGCSCHHKAHLDNFLPPAFGRAHSDFSLFFFIKNSYFVQNINIATILEKRAKKMKRLHFAKQRPLGRGKLCDLAVKFSILTL
jgi:hypothetical protein